MLKPILDVAKAPKVEGSLEHLVKQAVDALEMQVQPPKQWFGKVLEFTVRFSEDAEIQQLNKEFREKDKATNVLSFPAGEDMPGMEQLPEKYIGDILISCDTLEKEAKQQGKTVDNHLIHLLVHSILHLYGFDHIEDNEAEEMESLEIAILKSLGISDPYHK